MRSVLEIYLQGQKNLAQQGVDNEATKTGTLRAGNTGILTGKGEMVGSCHRKTWLRMKGIAGHDPVTFSKSLMFGAGVGNEDLWTDVLTAAQEQGLVIKREEEIPIAHSIGGVTITGRPDVVLGSEIDGIFKPETGLELKLASSLWTVRDVLFKNKPKTVHLMQAGHYAYQLGIPFEIWYTSRVNFAITDYSDNRWFAKKHFPKHGTPGSEYCSYDEENGNILAVEPFIHGFQIRWNNKDQLEYKAVNAERWIQTFVTWKGITDYYTYITRMEQDDTLGPRPINKEADGTNGGFDLCQARYCPLAYTCDNHERQGLKAWAGKVQELIASGTSIADEE